MTPWEFHHFIERIDDSEIPGFLDGSLRFQIVEIHMLESSSLENVIFLFWRMRRIFNSGSVV